MRGIAMVTTLSLHQQNAMVSTLKCPAFDIKQSPTGRLPEDHQVRTHTYPIFE